MLEQHGEFYPYGAAMQPDGKIVSVEGYDGSDKPLSQDIIKLLKDGFRKAAKNGEYIATGIFFDVKVTPPGSTEKTDAIAVALDHKQGYSVVVFCPYKILDTNVQFGDIFTEAGQNDIFIK